ncbi:MAG: hypothetical protein EXS41_03380 [Opitutaceae bacterium]|nr:hypothetical protein [Opitutaceae bacterium]
MKTYLFRLALCALLLGGLSACSKKETAATADNKPQKHEHHPPHGGTPVVLGEEQYHLELVREAATGTLTAYVLDGELENFIRIVTPALTISATVAGETKTLALAAISNAATGETVGDTSQFEGTAEWLKSTAVFDAVIPEINVRGTKFEKIAFNFPKGNDDDAK